MSTRNPIPKSALEHHLAFVGKTGSAKTGSVKSSIVEPALAAGERVCVIDPTGAWWGLRLDADGKSTGLPIYVFGGDHGDYPLLGTQGEMMAEAIGTSSTPAILDTTKMKTSERMKFFTDFADTILRTNKGPLRLVIDECHLFAPQAGTRGSGAMPDMLHAANNLISLGRSRGLRIVLISQRPAKVHKDSLTQVESLVAMRLIAPQDRKAIEEWIADQADKETGKQIISSLPGLKNGEAWVWSPEADFLKRVTFPFPKTYDSSKVQGVGKAAKRLSPIDLEKLQANFAKVKTEAEAKDPKILQRRVTELEAELRKAKAEVPAIDPAAVEAAEQRGFERGKKAVIAEAKKVGQETIVSALEDLRKLAAPLLEGLGAGIKTAKIAFPDLSKQVQFTPEHPPSGSPAAGFPAPAPSRPAPASPKRASSPAVGGDGDLSLSNPQRELLRSLAWWKAMGHDEPCRPQVAAIVGWKPTGSNLKDRLSELSKAGLVTYPRSGFVSLTEAGAAAAPEPNLSQTLIDGVRSVLTGPQLKLFDALEGVRREIARPDLAEIVGWEPNGSNLKDRLSELSRLEIVTYPSRGTVALQEWVVA